MPRDKKRSNARPRADESPRLPSPVSVSDHAVDRFIERWATVDAPQQTGDYYRAFLHEVILERAIRVENVVRERQSIWKYEGDLWGEDVILLLVVNENGMVTTVLPPGATKPRGRK